MSARRNLILATMLLGFCANSQSAQADVPTPAANPTIVKSSTAAPVSDAAATDLVYQDMRTMWDHTNHLKSTALDLLNEGRNSPSRQKWVAYYVSTSKEDIAILKNALATMKLPSTVAAAAQAPWNQVQAGITQIDGILAKLDTEAQGLKSPTDDHYPPVFWGTSKEFSSAAENLDKALVSVFSIMDTNISQTAPPLKLGNVPATNAATSGEPLKGGARMSDTSIGFKQVSDDSQKISKACWGLFGELERWNLLYGKPPAGGIGDGFYGGGLTQQEVLSEYKYLPTFTFTNAPYVMLYSYRLPPRQNMLAYHTGKIGKLMNLMEQELNDLQIPADRQAALAGPWEQTKKLFVDSRNDYLALYNLVQNTDDKRLEKNIREDQTTFGPPLMGIYEDMAKMRDALDDIKKILQ